MYEVPFWVVLTGLALIPGCIYLSFTFGRIPIMTRHLLPVAPAVVYLLVWWPPRRGRACWHRKLPPLTLGLIGYMVISAAWSGMQQPDRSAMM